MIDKTGNGIGNGSQGTSFTQSNKKPTSSKKGFITVIHSVCVFPSNFLYCRTKIQIPMHYSSWAAWQRIMLLKNIYLFNFPFPLCSHRISFVRSQWEKVCASLKTLLGSVWSSSCRKFFWKPWIFKWSVNIS